MCSKCTTWQKGTFLRSSFKTYLMSSFQKTKSTRNCRSVLVEKFIQPEEAKFELELIKIVDGFRDGFGNYTISLGT